MPRVGGSGAHMLQDLMCIRWLLQIIKLWCLEINNALQKGCANEWFWWDQLAFYRLDSLCRWCAGGCSPYPPGWAPAPAGTVRVWSGCSFGVWGSTTRSRMLCSPWRGQESVKTSSGVFSFLSGRAISGERGGNAVSQTRTKKQTEPGVR